MEGFQLSRIGRQSMIMDMSQLPLKKREKMQPYILIPDFDPGEALQHDGEEFFIY